MSRSVKGSKGPGWEPWSNLQERQKERADVSLREYRNKPLEDEREHASDMSLECDVAIYCHEHGPCLECRGGE